MKVLIAGGGVGGLALAQALNQAGVDVTVHEQDPTPTTRNQGFRIHIDANGNNALRTCLPPPTFDLVRRTSGTNDNVMGTYTHRLEEVMVQRFPGLTDDVITNVDRNTFRRALLTDLDVHFGLGVVGYQVVDGRVRVEFTDGSTDEGDLLVGADGIGSVVRKQLAPHAKVRDLGLHCLYGRAPITDVVPEVLRHGFNWVSDDKGLGAGFAPVRFRSGDTPDYLMVTLLGPEECLGRMGRMAEWHPALRRVFAEVDEFFPIALRAGQRVARWEPGPVTLLGDAIHAMPPTGGVGANTALQDAATLAGELLAGKSVVDAVEAYERVMLPRGFDTIEGSLRMAKELFAYA
jgi:2-polyprenyl-6-methoxyphenol hydroxylase-like FAD-dependent oxidoreductase